MPEPSTEVLGYFLPSLPGRRKILRKYVKQRECHGQSDCTPLAMGKSFMRTIAEILKALPTQLDTGLNPDAVSKSRGQFGVNRLTPLPREPLWKKFIEKFDEPIIKILLAAAVLSMVVDLFKASNIVGGVALVLLVVLLAGAYILKQAQWVPTLMFTSALLLFFVGLGTGHFLVEGLAVMVAVTLATG